VDEPLPSTLPTQGHCRVFDTAVKVLVACEFSGIVRDAFAARGHEAWSCDLLPTERPGRHICGNVLDYLGEGWDLMIAHPPCTHLATSGAAWFKEKIADGRQQEGIDFFMRFINAPIPRICVENPVSIMSRVYRKPDQIIHPYYFGNEAYKATCLWLKNLPLLFHLAEDDLFGRATHVGKGEFVVSSKGKRGAKWNWWLPQTPDRWKIRSRTFEGIAQAMAEQWGNKDFCLTPGLAYG